LYCAEITSLRSAFFQTPFVVFCSPNVPWSVQALTISNVDHNSIVSNGHPVTRKVRHVMPQPPEEAASEIIITNIEILFK